jgi:hypothetical protein
MFHFRESDSRDRAQQVLFFSSEMNVEKLIPLVKDHQAFYDTSDSDHRNRLHSQPLSKNCTGDGRKNVEGFAVFACFSDDNDDDDNKNKQQHYQ